MIAKISRLQWAAGLCIFTMLIFLAIDTYARGGGGRGSGGYSRSSAASHGSMRGRSPGSSRSRGRRDTRRDIHEERHDWHDDRRRRRAIRAVVGATLTLASWNALTCTRTRVMVNGVIYYSCGAAWYQGYYSGAHLTYVVVNTPPGY